MSKIKCSKLFKSKNKWVKGDWRTRHKIHGIQRCLEGAVNMASERYKLNTELVKNDAKVRLRCAIMKLFPQRSCNNKIDRHMTGVSITSFNDHKETTFRDIQKVCKLADKL